MLSWWEPDTRVNHHRWELATQKQSSLFPRN